MSATWTPASWRDHPPPSSPTGPTRPRSTAAIKQLSHVAPAGVRRRGPRPHRRRSARSPTASAFLLQAGDCAESFDAFSADTIRDKLKVILQMAVVLTYSSGVPIVKVGRIAGQFAKPRSSDTETDRRTSTSRRSAATSSTTSPSTEPARVPDPERLLQAYHQSASTLNLLRAFTKGGFADLVARPPVEPGVRGLQPRGPALRATRRRDRPGAAVHAACGIDTEPRARSCTRSTSTRATRRSSSATRRRSPARTRSPATGTTARPTCSGSASAPASSTAPTSSSFRRRRQPDRLQDRPDGHRRRGRSPCARRSTPTASPAGSR